MLICGEHSNEFSGYVEGWYKCWAAVNTVMNAGLHMSLIAE
jgi:hypothetical protein